MSAYDQPVGGGTGFGAAAVTPSDTVALAFTATSLYVGGAGNVSLLMSDGSTAALIAVPVGAHLRGLSFSRVNLTGTTATNLVAFR